MIATYVLVAIVVLGLIFVKQAIIIIPQSETKIVERLGTVSYTHLTLPTTF